MLKKAAIGAWGVLARSVKYEGSSRECVRACLVLWVLVDSVRVCVHENSVFFF